MAGHETVSDLMCWCLYDLANNPDACHQLEQEIDSILHDNEELTVDMLSRLTYTELVLKESLRLHPPIPAVARVAVDDNTLITSDGKEIHVKKGTNLILHLYNLHQ